MQFPCLDVSAVLLFWAVRSATSVRSGPTVQLRGYGPGHCVTVARSAGGSCVLRTRCEGQDISLYNFQFDCVGGQREQRVRHSLGIGSFDESEEFDTEVQCQRCLPPLSLSSSSLAHPDAAAAALTQVPSSASGAHALVKAGGAVLPEVKHEAHGNASYGVAPSLRGAAPEGQRPTTAHPPAGGRRLVPPQHGPPAVPLGSAPPQPPPTSPRRPRARIAELQLGATAGTNARNAAADRDTAAESDGVARAANGSAVHGGASLYGPSMCVSTWRDNRTGHCVLMTDCLPETDLSNYNFGFICVPDEGSVTRHLYGRNSFESHETYYTDVPCQQCLALDDKPMNSIDSITGLLQEVAELKAQIMNISAVINNLKERAVAAHPVQRAPPVRPGAHHPSQAVLLSGASPWSPRPTAPLLVERPYRAQPTEASEDEGREEEDEERGANEEDAQAVARVDAELGDQTEAGGEVEQVEQSAGLEETSQRQSGTLDGMGQEDQVQDE